MLRFLPLLLVLCFVGCKEPAPTPAPLPVPAPAPLVAPVVKVEYLAFTMTNCDPCKAMKPEWKKIGAKVHNVRQYPVLAQKYNITSCPTTVVLENGVENVAKRVVGYQKF